MEAEEAIKQRHATRIFQTDKPVAKETLEKIIKLAQRAPSWVNSQPWRVYIATGKKVAAVHAAHKTNQAKGIQAHPDWPTTHHQDWDPFPRKHMAEHGQHQHAYLNDDRLTHLWRPEMQTRLYDAPAICYLTLPKNSNNWSIFDLGSFAQTLMLTAKDLGVDSMPAYEFVRFPNTVRKLMGIPENEWVAMGIGLGYAKEGKINSFRSNRIPLTDMLRIED